MSVQRIRIKFAAFDHRQLDQAVKEVSDTVKRTGGNIQGPIPLPTTTEHFTVNRSPHIDKKSREQFRINTHTRVMIVLPTDQTIIALGKLELAAGVDIQIKVMMEN